MSDSARQDGRHDQWREIIGRVLRHELEWHSTLLSAVHHVQGTPHRPPYLPFGEIMESVFERTIDDATLQVLDDRERGQLAAHVIHLCLSNSSVDLSVHDEKGGGSDSAAEAVIRDVQKLFGNEPREFKDGLVAEVTAQATKIPDRQAA